jgi:mannose-1-phosphate guanylyltransferase
VYAATPDRHVVNCRTTLCILYAASGPEQRGHDLDSDGVSEESKYSSATEALDFPMSHVSTSDLVDQLEREHTNYLEVLSKDALSVELAQYPNPEPKTAHKTAELYYIISGSGMVHVEDERYAVDEGDVVYVEQGAEHDFFDIEDEITALVVFASAEDSVLGHGL